MKRIWTGIAVIVLALPLAGCWKDQQRAADVCATENPLRSKLPPSDLSISTPMTECMERRGYRLNPHGFECGVIAVPRRSPYCYEPVEFLARVGFELEMLYTPKPTPPIPPKM